MQMGIGHTPVLCNQTLSQAVISWLDTSSTSKSWGVNRHTVMHWPHVCGLAV